MGSLRTRMLVVSLLVALVAVVVTAWAVNRTTSNQVREAVQEDLEAEDVIYEELSFHAFANGSWDGIDDLVESLSTRFQERVALTTVEGEIISDSADIVDGGGLPLPDAPARFIHPDSPVIQFDEVPAGFLEGLAPLIEQGAELSAALEEAGVPFTLGEDFGVSYPVWDPNDPSAGPVIGRFLLEEMIGGAGGFVIPRPQLDLFNAESEALGAFLNELGIDFQILIDPQGLEVVEWDLGDPLAGLAVEEFFAEADPTAILDLVEASVSGVFEQAEPALLFLGVGDEDGALPDPIGWRLLLIVAGVALLAVAATLLATRQVLGPVGAVTRAARRMEVGDLSERVTVGGTDEIATLAGAFNAMADSLETQDRLRKSMTGDIAHELRTPLSNIRGYLEAIQEGVVEPSPEMIESIHEEAVLLQRLVDELQDLAQAEAGELLVALEETDLAELVESAVRAHGPRAEVASVVLEQSIERPIIANVDPGRIRQVIGNLLDNALRHTSTGDRIAVRLEQQDEAAVISVSDTGEGIAAEHLPHVFDRFYRADRSRSRETGGSGLGLAIAREVVRLHGGDISVESVSGQGTRFLVALPILRAGTADAEDDPVAG